MGVEFKVMTTPSDIEGVFSQFKRLLERNINKPVVDFAQDVDKKFYEILLRMIVPRKDENMIDNYHKIKSDLLKYRTQTTLNLERNLSEILSSFLKKQDISQEAKRVIFTGTRDEYLRDLSLSMFTIENHGMDAISEVIRLNQRYDYNMLFRGLKSDSSPEEIKQMFQDYRSLVKSDTQQDIMAELMKNPRIKRQFEQGERITIIDKNGQERNYDIQKYLDQRSDWISTQTIRTVKETEVVEFGSDVVMFVIVDDRPVKEPRDHHVIHEGKLFSLSGETTEYNGEPVQPISDIQEYEPFNSPYGCRHGLIVPPGYKK